MSNILGEMPESLKSLWNMEKELRGAAQSALFLKNDEARQHLEDARRHLADAMSAMKSGSPPPPVEQPIAPTHRDDAKI